MMTSANRWNKGFSITLSAMAVIALCFVTFLPVANAEEKPMNLISCRSGTVTMLSASKELTIYSYDIKGIDLGAKGDKTFENFTHRCVGVSAIKGGGGERLTKGYCKYMDPDGDFFIVSWDGPIGKEPLPFDVIHGTGKWKGIKGSGTVIPITRGKPIAKGTFQMCIEVTGTYELPPK